MEIKLCLLSINIRNDSVSSVVSSSTTSADVGFSSENVDKFTLA